MSDKAVQVSRLWRAVRLVVVCAFVVSWGLMGCGGCDDASGGRGTTGGPDTGDARGAGDLDARGSDAAADTRGGGDGGADAQTDTRRPPDAREDAEVCPGVVCGQACCDSAEECVQGQCLAPCAGTRCGEDSSLCCDGGDLCLRAACVTPGPACVRTEECEIDEICEPIVGKCLPRDAVDVCEYRPPVGEFRPVVKCSWPTEAPTMNPGRTGVVMAPVVANLTDDNGDGLTNTDDIPDIAFLTDNGACCNQPATLRIVSGECNPDGSMREIASVNHVQMVHDGSLAVGDLDGDGVPEILAISYNGALGNNNQQNPQGVVALRRVEDDGSEWEVMWRNTEYPTWNVHSRGGAIISIADLDGDGNPEVVVGNVALNGQTGELLWDGNVTPVAPGVTVTSRGVGNNAFLGPSSAIGDVDLDGKQEVMAGNTLYAHDGTVLWTYEYTSSGSTCQGPLPCDGFTAMANFDDDPFAEIVIIRQGEVFILEHTGELLWKAKIPQGSCARNESGPPTIADFNGDGVLDIGTAGADYYAVMSMACDPALNPQGVSADCDPRWPGVLWAKENKDCSSRATASSVFDFEGDGKAEMVYADETTFRIRSGVDGALRFEDNTHRSNTRIEMPVIADVDNDGRAEIVVAANGASNRGIKVWGDADDNWVRTRRIWNQHAYSVTNVTEDGQIPAQPQPNWQNSRLNNYRQQIQPGGVFDAPDLVVDALEFVGACAGAGEVSVRVQVSNRGALGQPAGVAVRVSAQSGADVREVATLQTTQRLLPGQFEVFQVRWSVPDGWWDAGFAVEATIDPDLRINECDESNNTLRRAAADMAATQPGLEVSLLETNSVMCGISLQLPVALRVTNTSSEPIAAGVPIELVAISISRREAIQVVRTTRTLNAGDSEDFQLDWPLPSSFVGIDFEVLATVDPQAERFTCVQKNSARDTARCTPAG